ncbi:CHAT domain-containing protein [Streptomyces sp. NPDC058653]|uniref:CHAT domain-containing protein n=1 Tax=Streptomyces sp. NPDC058653 TaxID=3346576 RepID=UPI0036612093
MSDPVERILELINALGQRVLSYQETQDAHCLLNADVPAEFAELRRLAGRPGIPEGLARRAGLAGAWLLLCRSDVLPPTEAEQSRDWAFDIFRDILLTEPELVPDLVRREVEAREAAAAGTGPDGGAPDGLPTQMVEEALRILDGASDPAGLKRGLDLMLGALDATPADHPFAFAVATSAGPRALQLFLLSGELAYLERAVSLLTSVVAALGADEPTRPAMLMNLSSALTARHRSGSSVRQPGDIDEALRHARESVALAPAGHEDHVGCVGAVVLALQLRYETTGSFADLDEAIATGLAVLAEPRGPNEDTAWARSTVPLLQGNLAAALRVRFEALGDAADLTESVRWVRTSIAATPPADPELPRRMVTLGTALSLGPRLPEGSTAGAGSVGVPGAGAPEGRASEARAPEAGPPAAGPPQAGAPAATAPQAPPPVPTVADLLEEAVQWCRKAESLLVEGSSATPDVLSGLGLALRARAEWLGDSGDAEEAVRYCENALARLRADDPRHAPYAGNLAYALGLLHELTGRRTVLDRAVAVGREAVAGIDATAPAFPVLMSTLGATLQRRFTVARHPDDINEAVEAGRAAVDALPDGHNDRAAFLSNLAVAHRGRHGWFGDPADLGEAVRLISRAVALVAVDDPERTSLLSHLGMLLRVRYERDAAPADLAEALKATFAAVSATPTGHPEAAGRANNYALAALAQYESDGDTEVLENVIRLARQVLDDTSADRPDHPGLAGNLAFALRRRHDITGSAEDADEALRLWREAAHRTDAPPHTRLVAAENWAVFTVESTGDARAAMPGYALGVDLLRVIAGRGLDRAGGEQALAHWTRLAADAAGNALAAEEPEQALLLLEAGRAVIWSQLLENRADMSGLLTDDDPVVRALARRLGELRDLLGTLPDPAASSLPVAGRGGGEGAAVHRTDRRMELAAELDRTVEELRARRPDSAFLSPPGMDALHTAAADGPVVVVNVGRWRCDALVLHGGRIRVVPLDVSAARVAEQAQEYLTALQTYETEQRSFAAALGLEDSLTDILAWLWDEVAGPVLDELALTAGSDGEPARMWWCPTGPLALLPLHAAGHHYAGAPPDWNVPDRVVSSYALTLRALLDARAAAHGGTGPGTDPFLVVALPEPPALPETDTPAPGEEPLPPVAALPAVARERDRLRELLTDPAPTVLEGPEALRSSVRAAMETHRWVHLGSHGTQRLDAPSKGGVLLADGVLTIAELADGRGGGEFVLLSACKTALGGAAIPDELVSVTAVLQYAGWRHVIGTLWSVDDERTADLTGLLYERMIEDGTIRTDLAARALHGAVRTLRRDDIDNEVRWWIPYLHAGP